MIKKLLIFALLFLNLIYAIELRIDKKKVCFYHTDDITKMENNICIPFNKKYNRNNFYIFTDVIQLNKIFNLNNKRDKKMFFAFKKSFDIKFNFFKQNLQTIICKYIQYHPNKNFVFVFDYFYFQKIVNFNIKFCKNINKL